MKQLTAPAEAVTCPTWCTTDHGDEPHAIRVHRRLVAATQLVEVRLTYPEWTSEPRVEIHNLDRAVVADLKKSILRLPVAELPAQTALMNSLGRRDVGTLLGKASALLASKTAPAMSDGEAA